MLFKRTNPQPPAPWRWFYIYTEAIDRQGATHFRRVNRMDRWIDAGIRFALNLMASREYRAKIRKAKP